MLVGRGRRLRTHTAPGALGANRPFEKVAGGEAGQIRWGLDARPSAWTCSCQGYDKKRKRVWTCFFCPSLLVDL